MSEPQLLANLPTEGAVPGRDGSWPDKASLIRHLQVQAAISRNPESRLVCRTHLAWPRGPALATGAPWHAVWRGPQGQWAEALGCADLCPQRSVRLLPEGHGLRPHPGDIAAAQTWLAGLQVNVHAFVVAGFPQEVDGLWQVPLTLWLPRLWIREGQPLQVACVLDRRQPVAQLADELGVLLMALQHAPPAAAAHGPMQHAQPADLPGALDLLQRRELDKLVLGWPLRWPSGPGPGEVLARLQGSPPEAWTVAFSGLQAGSTEELVCCASPELLARVDATTLNAVALAGTLPGGEDSGSPTSSQLRREHDLVTEHLLTTLRGLGADPVAGSLQTRKAGPLYHLATSIRAPRPAGVDALAMALALHPTPALLGCPRGPALLALRGREPEQRSWYGGFAGVLAADGSGRGELAVLLRGAGWQEGVWTAWAGAGLVAGTDVESETVEINRKHSAIAELLGLGGCA